MALLDRQSRKRGDCCSRHSMMARNFEVGNFCMTCPSQTAVVEHVRTLRLDPQHADDSIPAEQVIEERS